MKLRDAEPSYASVHVVAHRLVRPEFALEVFQGLQSPLTTHHSRPRKSKIEPTPISKHDSIPAAVAVARSECHSLLLHGMCHGLPRPATQAYQPVTMIRSPAPHGAHDSGRRYFTVSKTLAVYLDCYEPSAAFLARQKQLLGPFACRRWHLAGPS